MLPPTTHPAIVLSAKPIAMAENGVGSSSGSGNGELDASEKASSGYSGYSADKSAAVASLTKLPTYIGLLDDNGRGIHQQNQKSESRSRKNVELYMTASRAKEYIEAAGMTVPQIKKEATRDLDGVKIDMSKVHLAMAETVKDSPFLYTRNNSHCCMPEDPDIFNSLFISTYQSYHKDKLCNVKSSASFVTSSEGYGSMSCVDDFSKNRSKEKPSKRKRALIDPKASKLAHITMNEALKASQDARVVTLSFAPFIVVHVNTAYIKSTGNSSVDVLGRSLHECIGGKCKNWLDSSREAKHPVAALHDRVSTLTSGGQKLDQYRLQISLVGPQLEGKKLVDKNTVTHYSITFLPNENTVEEPLPEKRCKLPTASVSISSSHKLVMG